MMDNAIVKEHSTAVGMTTSPGPEVIKLFSCSTQLRLKF